MLDPRVSGTYKEVKLYLILHNELTRDLQLSLLQVGSRASEQPPFELPLTIIVSGSSNGGLTALLLVRKHWLSHMIEYNFFTIHKW